MTASTDQERFVVTRTISASPARVFAVLADPARHCDYRAGRLGARRDRSRADHRDRPDLRDQHVPAAGRRALRDAQPE